MKELKSEFLLPIKGLHMGTHQYMFRIIDDFFQMFDHSYVNKGLFEAKLELEKKSSMLVLEFEIEGYLEVPCDICLKQIRMPIEAKERYVVKFTDELRNEEEVVYVEEESGELDVSGMILETIQLHTPLRNEIDCESNDYKDCDQATLKYLKKDSPEQNSEGNDIWRELKNIKLN